MKIFCMPRSKFPVLEKLKLFKEFKESYLPKTTFARQYGIGKTTFRIWLMRYQQDGLEGLEKAKKNKHYSKYQKQNIVFVYLNIEGTLTELTAKYGLRSIAQAKVWVTKYNEGKSLRASPLRKRIPLCLRRRYLKSLLK